MRTWFAVSVCVVVLILGAQTGSTSPRTVLVSPALAINNDQRLECAVVNTDASAHTVAITFYDSSGTEVSGNPPQSVAPHG